LQNIKASPARPSDSLIRPADSKIEVLESLRAFAALSVCLYHFVCTTTGYIQAQWLLDVFSVGKYGVQLFFVISGFVIPLSMYKGAYTLRKFFTFFLKRVSRLEPPYVFSIVFALAIFYVKDKYMGGTGVSWNATQVALHFCYLVPFFNEHWLNPVYWTLAIEFQYYLLIAFVFVALTGPDKWLRYLVYFSMLALSFVGSSAFLFYWLPVFLLGILLFLYKTNLILRREYVFANAITIAFCFYMYPFASVIYMLLPIGAVLFYPDLKVPGFHFTGKFSYSIYLMHSLTGASVINLLSHHYTSPVEKFCVIVLGIIVTLISGYVMYLFIEKPSKNLSASFQYKKWEPEVSAKKL
jgi:peptidoglycan/LPS O-acetylase OafA/YrhL